MTAPQTVPVDSPPAPTHGVRLAQTGLIVLLIIWCFHVVRPFVQPMMWGVILAVSLYPIHERIERALMGKRAWSAALTTLLALTLLVIPIAYLGNTLVETAEHLSAGIDKGSIQVPPPPEGLADTPMVGPTLHKHWLRASQDKSAVRELVARYSKPVGAWLLKVTAGVGLSIGGFVVALLIAGVLLARRQQVLAWARSVVLRLAPNRGPVLTHLAQETIRNVSQGVVGVALIQAVASGIGLVLVGMPAAGFLSLICFMLAVIQIGVLPVLLPAALYVLFTADMLVAIPFAIWCSVVGLIDNFLRPLLLHQGMKTPLWVIIVGSIGGLLSSGITGLFVGPVLLVLAYELAQEWMSQPNGGKPEEDATPPTPDPIP